MEKWILSPNEIDWNAGTVTPLPWGGSSSYRAENAVFDVNGDLLFYVKNLMVFNKNGTNVGSLPVGHSNVTNYWYQSLLQEISLVPVPGSCNSYYAIYCLATTLVGTAIHHATITINPDGSFAISTDVEVLDQSPGNSSAIAVTTIDANDPRKLYWVAGYGGVFSYEITANGIVSAGVVLGYSFGNPMQNGLEFNAIEAEINQSGNLLVWTEWPGVAGSLPPNLTENPKKFELQNKDFWGIEFDESEAGFYVSSTGVGTTTTTAEIWHYPDIAANAAPILVTGSNGYGETLIERAKDGQFYAVNQQGVLGEFSGNGPVSPAFGGLQVFSDDTWALFGHPIYKLPDQIDGEDYSYFYGVPDVDITGMTINGQALADAVPPPPPCFYNCEPINLIVNSTGQLFEWQIQIYSVDPNTGNQLFGSPYLYYSLSGTGPIPTPMDLRTIKPGVPDLFANYLGQTFAIHVSGINKCRNAGDYLLCYFKVLGAPSAAQINLQVNPGNGIPCSASHDFSNPCPASIWSASLNAGNSQGDISFYSLKIEHVECGTGEVISMIYESPAPVSVSGASQLTALALNDLEINGSTGYFADPNWCCSCLRVELTIGNACGSSTDFSFLKFNVSCPPCFRSSEAGNQAESVQNHPVASLESIRISPNPTNGQIRIYSVESDWLPELNALTLFGPTGAEIFSLKSPIAGEPIDISGLPEGFYFWSLETASGRLTGKIHKI